MEQKSMKAQTMNEGVVWSECIKCVNEQINVEMMNI